MALAMRNHTFQFYDRLTASGMTDSQARTIIEAISDLSDMNLKELATKADLKDFPTRADLKEFATKADLKDLATVEQLMATNNKIDALRAEIKTDCKDFATNEKIDALRAEIKTDFKDFATNKKLDELKEDANVFKVAIEKRFSSLEVSIEKRFSSFEVSIEKRFSELEVSMEKNTTALHAAIAKASASAIKIVLVGFSIPVILSITVLVVSGAFKHLGL
jgi:hypothetical protein